MPNKRIFKKLLTLGNSTFSSDLKPDILSKKNSTFKTYSPNAYALSGRKNPCQSILLGYGRGFLNICILIRLRPDNLHINRFPRKSNFNFAISIEFAVSPVNLDCRTASICLQPSSQTTRCKF